jgi:hypothetical protein
LSARLSASPERVHAANVGVHGRTFGTALLLVACGFDTGGVGSGSASIGADTSGSEAGSATMASASASAETSGATDATSPTTDPSDSVDSTVTAVDSSEATTSPPSTTDDDGTSTTSADAMIHHLMPTQQTDCSQPLWCFSGDVWNEVGDPIYGQQCFTSPVAPPFELLSVHYIVADVAPELTGFMLEVQSRDAEGPTGMLSFEQKFAGDATPGDHEHVFEPPMQIVDPQFCVGFSAPYEGLAGGLGMAVDVGSSVGDVSFIRLEGPQGCVFPSWTDVIDDFDPTPSGNWCIDVQIREIP